MRSEIDPHRYVVHYFLTKPARHYNREKKMFIFVFSKMVLEQPDKFREEKMYLDFCLMKYTIINSRWILDSNTI